MDWSHDTGNRNLTLDSYVILLREIIFFQGKSHWEEKIITSDQNLFDKSFLDTATDTCCFLLFSIVGLKTQGTLDHPYITKTSLSSLMIKPSQPTGELQSPSTPSTAILKQLRLLPHREYKNVSLHHGSSNRIRAAEGGNGAHILPCTVHCCCCCPSPLVLLFSLLPECENPYTTEIPVPVQLRNCPFLSFPFPCQAVL